MTLDIVKKAIVVALLTLGSAQTGLSQAPLDVYSPDVRTLIRVRLPDPSGASSGKTQLHAEVEYDGKAVVPFVSLGITRKDQAFVDGLKFIQGGPARIIDETYPMLTGKRRLCRDYAQEVPLVFENSKGARLELIVRAYNDGVAFRYRFPESSGEKHIVTSESTGFRLPQDGKMWAHPYDRPSKYTPAYETYFVNGVAAGTASATEFGWAFPVLFCTGDRSRWALLTEAGLDGSYCGCHLTQKAVDGVYRIQFPGWGRGQSRWVGRALVDVALGHALAGHHPR